MLNFTLQNGQWTAGPDVADTLTLLVSGWRFVTSEDDIEMYDLAGRLLSIEKTSGLRHTVSYYSSGPYAGLPSGVTDSYGKNLSFEYGNFNGLTKLGAFLDPSGGRFQFDYLSRGLERTLLGSVTYPGVVPVAKRYHYNEQNLLEQDWLLTGTTDENGSRYSTYGYIGRGRANSTVLAGGVNANTIAYSDLRFNGTAVVTNALGGQRTYKFGPLHNVMRNLSISGGACPECGPAQSSYLGTGQLGWIADSNGNRTSFVYDLSRNLETQRTEAQTVAGSSTTQTRIKNTAWHASYRLPIRIAEPLRISTMTYGDPSDPNPGNRGSLLIKSLQATTDASGALGFAATVVGTPRTWTYTYNGNGSVLTVDGPRTDVSDVTSYTYYANDATCPGASAMGCRGQVETITNPVGHVTRFTQYNAHGQPLEVVDPNGLVTTLTYDARMRLTSRSVGGELTSYQYDAVGQLIKITLPDGSFLAYTYDPAHRLTQIADNAGNRIVYTLDLMGNRIKEETFDPMNQLAQLRTRVYSNLNRLAQELGASGQATSFAYDGQGNVTSVDGPLAGSADTTSQAYDPLNRLIRVTDPKGGQTTYGYDGLDQITSVTDPRGLVTSYAYDGLGNLGRLTSPDTGVTTNTYDAAGNLLTQTDAQGQVTAYAYDALNRVTSITYQGGATHTFEYDLGVFGKGRLSRVAEPGSVTQYGYDQKGRLLAETRTINGVNYTTSYRYDSVGRLAGVTYPGGREVAYTFDALGRVQDLSTVKEGVTRSIVTGVSYRPFGPPQGFTFGNGQSYTRGYDADGRVTTYTQGAQTFALGYDVASRITGVADTASPSSGNAYTYDALDRLTGYIGPVANQAYGYDAVGNRLFKTTGAATELYGYGQNSNLLLQITGGTPRTFGYDANGSVTSDTGRQFVYDARGRLAQAIAASVSSSYHVNSFGQRIRKTNAQGDIVYHYDAQGRLIAESSPAGEIQKEYVYLGDIPVAILQ